MLKENDNMTINLNALKQKLNNKNIQYEEINDIELMISKGFNEVPLLEIDGVIYTFAKANEILNNLY